jgi:hypothetical protein
LRLVLQPENLVTYSGGILMLRATGFRGLSA